MNAIILAAGKGTRLKPFTLNYPKPLFKIKGKTLLERNIHFLHSNGIEDITIITGYKHHLFDEYIEKYNLNKLVSTEWEYKNSSSSLKLAKNLINNTIIINGDIYIQKNVFDYIQPHCSQIISQKIKKGKEDGYIFDENKRIIQIVKNATSGYGDTGMMVLQGHLAKEVANNLPFAQDNDFWEDVVYRLIDQHALYLTPIPSCIVEIDSLDDALAENILNQKDLDDLKHLNCLEK